MAQNQQPEYVDWIDMGLADPDLEGWDGRSSRVDPGFYDFEVVTAAPDQSRRGNPTLVVTYKVVSDGPMAGRTMRQSYSLMRDNDGARRRIKHVLDALMAERTEDGRFSPAGLIGLRLAGEVVTQTYDDVDARTGQPVVRESNKIVGETAIMQAPVQTRPPAQQRAPQPAGQPVGQGQPVATRQAPGNSQGQPPMRR